MSVCVLYIYLRESFRCLSVCLWQGVYNHMYVIDVHVYLKRKLQMSVCLSLARSVCQYVIDMNVCLP